MKKEKFKAIALQDKTLVVNGEGTIYNTHFLEDVEITFTPNGLLVEGMERVFIFNYKNYICPEKIEEEYLRESKTFIFWGEVTKTPMSGWIALKKRRKFKALMKTYYIKYDGDKE